MNSFTDIDLAVDVLLDAFEMASEETFMKRRPTNGNKTSRWWNSSREVAVAEIKATRSLTAKQLKELNDQTHQTRLGRLTTTSRRFPDWEREAGRGVRMTECMFSGVTQCKKGKRTTTGLSADNL